MMEVGTPREKRARIGPHHPSPPQWTNPPPQPNASRNLPPLGYLPPPPPHAQSPFSRSDPPQSLPSIVDRERRHSGHSEHSHYEPQDHRRPHSVASHGYQPPQSAPPLPQPASYSGQRDPPPRGPMIKRDSSDEPQYGRSPNNPSDHNVNHHPPHDGARVPYQHQHPSLPYEPPHQPPQQHRTNSYPPPPSPMSAPDQFNGNSYPRQPHFPPHEGYVSYPPQQGTPRLETKRKATRAAQACDSCRTLKAKCDEGRPSCGTCKEKDAQCNYRDPPPKIQDKTSVETADALGRIENLLGVVTREIMSTNRRIDGLEQQIQQRGLMMASEEALKQESFKHEVSELPQKREETHFPGAYPRHSNVSDKPLMKPIEPTHSPVPEEILQPLRPEEASEEDEGGDPRPHRPPTIPVNHTTGAARLLSHVAIRELVKDIIGPGHHIRNEKYPMVHEERRGSLRLFGRGEGTDVTPGYDKDTAPDHVSDSTPGDTHSDTSSPAPGDPEWLTPPPNPLHEVITTEINSNGMPDFSRETVTKLVQSYKDHINIMHPILVPHKLDAMVEVFLKSLPETTPSKPKPNNPLFVGANWNPESPGTKRKRSPGAGETQEIPNFWDQNKPGHPFRTITSALVLFVLALGKLCLHKGRIPDVAVIFAPENENANVNMNSPVARNGYPPSPMQNSPAGAATLPSPADLHPRSRRTSMEAVLPRIDRSKLRNIDIIAGLDYFAFATDIIGNQLGANKLQHIHANILASLYHGQLGRVLESHAYIYQACYGLQTILRRKVDRFKKLKDTMGMVTAKDNPIVFAFWTCLQLESDIIAELPVIQSGILTFEEDMPSPNLKVAVEVDGFDPLILESYMAQLFLRQHLNRLHGLFYKPEIQPVYPAIHRSGVDNQHPTIDVLDHSISIDMGWAPHMRWDEKRGERSSDILHARLRAKYYGAKVITFRPFILKIMEASRPASAHSRLDDAGEAKYRDGVGAPFVNPNATSAADIDPKCMEYARKGLLALVHSTSAFHDVVDPGSERLLVTNIWGTAHAQWGNLVTLQAAYNDPILNPLVLEIISLKELTLLLEKTIAFLSFSAMRSSALYSDTRILKHIGRVLDLLPRSTKPTPRDPISAHSSFVSESAGREVTMSGATY